MKSRISWYIILALNSKKTITKQEYAEFTERAREHRKEMELEDAIRTTIDECIRDGILKDFLLKNKAEVYHM